MRTFITLAFVFCLGICSAQTGDYHSIKDRIIDLGAVSDNNEDFSNFEVLKKELQDVEIVMLGEQSHGEGTVYETKIKLIKYLHQELGYDLLIFESGFYDCKKAWDLIEQGADVKTSLARSIFTLWSTTREFEPLAEYIENQLNTDQPLKVLGFDNQLTGKISEAHFLKDLETYLNPIHPSLLNSSSWRHFEKSMQHLLKLDLKALKKMDAEKNMTFLYEVVELISKEPTSTDRDFWINTIESTKAYLSDLTMKTDLRDEQMAKNLMWIKDQYTDKKIICWGATSHFLYNSREIRMKNLLVQMLAGHYYKKHDMMGHYVKDAYKSKVYTIGFTSNEGKFGLFRNKKIKAPKEGTFEDILNDAPFDNFLLPLEGLNFPNNNSRPLGNMYMEYDIAKVMDAVIFNRYMKRPKLDRNFFLEIYPENKYIKPEVEEIGE